MAEQLRGGADEALILLNIVDRFDRPEFEHAWRVFINMASSCLDYQSFMANCPPHSDERAEIERVLRMYDVAAALVKQGAVRQDVLFGVLPSPSDVWQKADPWVAGIRTENSMAHRNLEWLAAQYDAWLLTQMPGT